MLGVHAQVQARGEKREALQQALHVGVRDISGVQGEVRGDFGILPGKFSRHVPNELQLPLVVTQKASVHQERPPVTET